MYLRAYKYQQKDGPKFYFCNLIGYEQLFTDVINISSIAVRHGTISKSYS